MREWVKLYRDEPARFASLSLGARMLAAYMLKFADKDGRFPLGYRDPVTAIAVTIGADVGDRRTMRRTVQELITHGYLTVGAGTVDIVSWPKYQADVKRSPTEHEPSTNTTRVEHEPSTNRARTEHENRPKCAESNGGTERALIRVEEKREEESTRPPSRGTSAMLATLTPNDRTADVIRAVSDARQAAGGGAWRAMTWADKEQAQTIATHLDALGGVEGLRRAADEYFAKRGKGSPIKYFAEDPGQYATTATATPTVPDRQAAYNARDAELRQEEYRHRAAGRNAEAEATNKIRRENDLRMARGEAPQ